MRLAFAGTPEAAVPTLRALLDAPGHEVVAVVTRPPAPAGRGRRALESPVSALATEAGVPVLTPQRPSEPEFLARLTQLRVDCCPVVAYGALLPPPALAVPAHGWVNLHFSLLPAWRGAAPVQHAIRHGDDVTGASTFLIEAGLDTGPVYGVVTEAIRADDTAGDLLGRLAISGAALMVVTLDGIASGQLVAVPQPPDGVSIAPKVTVEDARVDWTAPGRPVERAVRACTPAPGAWTAFRGERLKLGPVRLCDSFELAPGRLAVSRSGVTVGTATTDVELGQVQPPGKRPMAAPDWARGARIEPGSALADRRAPARRGPSGSGSRSGSGSGSGSGSRSRRRADPARLAAYEVLRAVAEQDAYANLVLPGLLTAHGLSGRDAAFATELGYGTLRALGSLDEILGCCVDRPLADVDPAVLDLLRLGAYQALRTRVPAHAAVATTVDLASAVGQARASGFVNAVLRRVVARTWAGWTDELASGASTLAALAVRTAHPRWIVEAFAAALGVPAAALEATAEATDRDQSDALAELATALAADDERPRTHLVAWPGRGSRAELLAVVGGEAGPYSPYAVRMAGGLPGDVAAIREHRAGVQDEGSQLCALALVAAALPGRDERWLDLCAGPGGKAALLAALAGPRGAVLSANELRPHRAELVRRATGPWSVEVRVGDAREIPEIDGGYDRILLDAPCTGLGALRRRPEARWRRRAEDVPALSALQRDLLAAALRLVRPGGIVGYVTCSPHPGETVDVVAGHELLDARPAFAGVPDLGPGPTVQLWPHRHGTDAMFCALVRRP